jgi:MFS family permease
VGPAGVAIALWLAFGLVFGISGPIRMGYVNEHIPSAQRATVLSLDALFSDVGGSVGQPALGWVSTRASVSWALLIGSAFISGVPLLYRASGRAATREAELASKPLPLSEPCTPGGSVVGDLERQIPDYCPL